MSDQINLLDHASLMTAMVGQIAASRAGAAAVFQRFGIDFCCHGDRTLADVLKSQGITPALVIAALEETTGTPLEDWRDAATPLLIEHIKTRYHAVHLAELPKLRDLAAKIEATHRNNPAVPAGLVDTLARLFAEIRLHQQREEVVLFPLLQRGGSAMAKDAIQIMRAEHDDHGAALSRIETITHGFAAPSDACASWRALYLGLEKFRDDLTTHVHLENNILFPRFEATEEPDHGNPVSGRHH